jgi:hypothetical protein
MPFLLAQIAPESFLIGGWQAAGGGRGSASSSTASARRRFQFHKRSQLFIGTNNKALSVAAMRVHNPDFSTPRN